jgi:hypothetical protein
VLTHPCYELLPWQYTFHEGDTENLARPHVGHGFGHRGDTGEVDGGLSGKELPWSPTRLLPIVLRSLPRG